MRRILSVIPAPTFGGSANQLLQLAGPLRERGWETVAVAPTEPGSVVPRLRAAGIEVHEVPTARLRATADPRAHAAYVRSLVSTVGRLRALIRETGADAVQNHGDLNPHAAVAGHREGVAVVWQILDTRTPPRLRRLTAPVIVRVADAVTTWGMALGEGYPGVVGLGPRHVVVFPPVDGTRFAPRPEQREAARAELQAGPEDVVVALVANRNPQKGLEWFVRAGAEARRRVPDLALRIVGAPSAGHEAYEAGVLAEARDLGLLGDRLLLIDPGTRVPELLQGVDVLALSSVPRSEGMPTVIAEAMACGLPVAATDVGAVSELVDHEETGLVVAPRDAPALGEAIARLAGDAALRVRLGAAGRARQLETLSLEACADRHAEAYEAALAHRAARR